MEKDQIAILLSTYNGELYLEQQIESIITQDYKNWKLFIRDDRSQDSTKEIIKKYSEKYNNIYFIEEDCNKGAALSFMHLLSLIDSDYYMFCDQDDIWYDNKISTVFNILKETNNDQKKPVLVFSDSKVVDQDLRIIHDSFWNYNKIFPKLILSQPDYISVFNCAPGCTMIFNRELKNHLTDYDENIIMHDWYIMIKALQNGTVQYYDKALMLYRQHQNNVMGASKISFTNRFSKIFKIKYVLKSQIQDFCFVRQYTKINIFKFYGLKLKFNLLRFKK